ncbi:6-O-methylguanine DNA methyltransferase [Croceicoccus estronivorus]|uniref:bifunctional transcriptional activator/DNA repair enzyme AdaA n=1 Tax=Croceicoccus estronivorus TaxID=1172626 RepID=UPI00082ADAE3|nr:methylated-DNA--[protein]-cysteine S-methyltransferase [Croceicoccus estronivorus]OCC22713.1 6-O-methylguanine DNA methyltransferase [Croceicoccus estronivorus]
MMIEDPERLKAMRAAFAARDRSKDGDFVVAVRSTRIYCRPSCPARRPRAENIAFYSDSVSAEAAGFRPCKRCRPDEAARDVQAVLVGIAALRDAGQALTLAELSSLTGYSSGHFQRVFKRATGLSPAAYGRALRAERAQEVLSDGKRVSDAIYDAGFAVPSRFYEAMEGRLGMVPSAWLNGGAGSRIFWSVVDTSLGAMLVAATDKGVCRLAFDEGVDDLARRFPNADLVEGGKTFSSLLERVVASVERPGTEMDIPLDVRGTAFQEQVWEALKAIPAGETRTYAQIAAAVGSPKAVRAAGSANGANPVAVLVPCHRVIRSDGSLGGYAYGNEIKQELLRREQNK